MTLGMTMAILVGGGLGLGLLVDDWLGSSPVGTLVGLAVGVALAAAALWQRAKQYL
jgi:F0F1-type ATP synthase assembly protein I